MPLASLLRIPYWSQSGKELNAIMDEKQSTGLRSFLLFRLFISLMSFPGL